MKRVHYTLNTVLYCVCQFLGYVATVTMNGDMVFKFVWAFGFSFLITLFHNSNKGLIDNDCIDIF